MCQTQVQLAYNASRCYCQGAWPARYACMQKELAKGLTLIAHVCHMDAHVIQRGSQRCELGGRGVPVTLGCGGGL